MHEYSFAQVLGFFPEKVVAAEQIYLQIKTFFWNLQHSWRTEGKWQDWSTGQGRIDIPHRFVTFVGLATH